MDGVKSLSSMSSSTPVNKVRDVMSQATQRRSLDIVKQSEDMTQARRKSSAIENELVRTTQTDCWSPVSSHLLSAEKAIPQATMRQSEEMAPARRKSSVIENVLIRTAQTDCESPVSSHLLSEEKAMPQETPPTSLDISGQSENMPPGTMKISSAIGNELTMLLATPPASSDIVGPLEDIFGQSEDMPPGKMKISSAIGNELAMRLATPPASDIVEPHQAKGHYLLLLEMSWLEPLKVIVEVLLQVFFLWKRPCYNQLRQHPRTLGHLEDMAPARRKMSSAIENELVRAPQADYRSPVSSLLSVEKGDRPE